MPDSGWIAAAGAGSALIDGGAVHLLSDIVYNVDTTTSPKVRVIGAGLGALVQYGGRLGVSVVGTDDTGAFAEIPIWQFNVRALLEDNGAPPSIYADTVWWQLPPGITLHVRVFW